MWILFLLDVIDEYQQPSEMNDSKTGKKNRIGDNQTKILNITL